MSDLGFTYIYESARKRMDISRDEYALCNYIQTWASYPSNSRPGWCDRTVKQKAEFIGVTDRGLQKMQTRLIELGLIEKDPNLFHYRITRAWFELVTQARQEVAENKPVLLWEADPRRGEQSSARGELCSPLGVNKVPEEGEQSSPLGVNKVHPHTNNSNYGLNEEVNKTGTDLKIEIFEMKSEILKLQRRREKHSEEQVLALLNQPEGLFFQKILSFGVWQDYLAHKSEIRVKAYASPKSESLAVQKLFELSGGEIETAKKIVKQTRANNWTGLFPLKDGKHTAATNGTSNPGFGGDFFGGGSNPFFSGVKKDS